MGSVEKLAVNDVEQNLRFQGQYFDDETGLHYNTFRYYDQLHSRDTGQLIDSEEFRYDAAANRLNFNTSQFDHVKDNRLKRWRDQEYAYDAWGNLIEKRSGMSKLQTFVYDCENRLVRAETFVHGRLESTGSYRYDSLGRRVGKPVRPLCS